MRLPVHPSGAFIEHLHAIAAAVALARIRILRKHHGQRDEPTAIVRPALQHRKIVQREIFFANHFLARPVVDDLGKERAHLRQHRQHFQFADDPLRHAHLQKFRDAPRHVVGRALERHLHPLGAGESVDQHRHFRALGIFKQQRRTAVLHAAVGELRDLQFGIDLERNALQLPALL